MTSSPSAGCPPTSWSESTARRLAYRQLTNTTTARAAELALCAADVVHWCDRWCWTYDPRQAQASLPFDLFPRQAELLRWLAERERLQQDGLVEKSREV